MPMVALVSPIEISVIAVISAAFNLMLVKISVA
jgi:hypothetical protein